jgi:PBSX family phage portal protein
MNKRRNRSRNMAATDIGPSPTPPAKVEAFTFGEPVPVLDGRDILDCSECWLNGRWYEPPISFTGLAKASRASTHHSSALFFKRNMLAKSFIPHRLLSREAFGVFALDFLVFGNAYLERRRSRLGTPVTLQPALGKYMRRGADLDTFFLVRGWQDEHEFERGSVFQLREPDINQEIYGLPEYIGTIQAVLLNESATLFRRRYYNNGSHAGFILYMTDAVHNEEDIDSLRTAMRNAKGPGNFRNLFLYAPGGKKDGVQVIPVSEVAAKDEFFNIKNVTRDDVLAAHRIPPQLIGIVPSNAGGFGSIKDASEIYHANEIVPLQERMRQVNDWAGEEVIRFQPYESGASTP